MKRKVKDCGHCHKRLDWLKGCGYKPDCKGCQVGADMRWRHGVTLDEYNKMFDAQAGACAICGQPETSNGRHGKPMRLAIDHNHATGKVRALLCANCNQGIGNFGESVERLQAAIEYIQKHQ